MMTERLATNFSMSTLLVNEYLRNMVSSLTADKQYLADEMHFISILIII